MPQASQEYLDELYEKRRKQGGIKSITFDTQATEFDSKWLDEEIQRVEQALDSSRAKSVRFGATSKGL